MQCLEIVFIHRKWWTQVTKHWPLDKLPRGSYDLVCRKHIHNLLNFYGEIFFFFLIMKQNLLPHKCLAPEQRKPCFTLLCLKGFTALSGFLCVCVCVAAKSPWTSYGWSICLLNFCAFVDLSHKCYINVAFYVLILHTVEVLAVPSAFRRTI